MYQKKVISKNVTEKCPFLTFTHVRQTFLLITFFWCIFAQLFQRIRNQRKILRFLTPFFILKKKKNFRSYLYFFRTLKPDAQQTAQKIKNVFCKCVLDFNFAPIKGSVFFIF